MSEENKNVVNKKIQLSSGRRMVLNNRQLSSRMSELFSELSKNEELQQAFIESPSEVIGQGLFEKNYTPEQSSVVNKFIYSVLANEDLQKWAAEYDRDNASRKLTLEERQQDLAIAFIKFGDSALMSGMLELIGSGATAPGVNQASLLVKQESVAIGNWFVYKVSGKDLFRDGVILPPNEVQKLANQLIAKAKQLKKDR